MSGTMIYRRTEVYRTAGTVNLRAWLRQHLSARAVNDAMVLINREPYVTHVFPTAVYGLDVSVEITPASGKFECQELWW